MVARLLAVCFLVAGIPGAEAAPTDGASGIETRANPTTLAQLRDRSRLAPGSACSFRMAAVVYDVLPSAGLVVLLDNTGFELVDLPPFQEDIRAGQRVFLEGAACLITQMESGIISIRGTPGAGSPGLCLAESGAAPVAEPVFLTDGQAVGKPLWVEVEGTVVFVVDRGRAIELEVASRAERLRVLVADGSGLRRELLLGNPIRVIGFCRSVFARDGRRTPSEVTTLGWRSIRLLAATAKNWEAYPLVAIRDINRPGAASNAVIHVAGRIRAVQANKSVVVDDGSGEARVSVPRFAPLELGDEVEMLGIRPSGSPLLLAVHRPWEKPSVGGTELPLLRTIEQVKRLKREEAQRAFPVRLRGVVTSVRPEFCSAVLQDGTRGIYVSTWNATLGPLTNVPIWASATPPLKGDYWEIEGVTDPGDFAPLVRCQRAVWLGAGSLPEPLRPSWDQLANGSLDTEYVEVQGIVTAVDESERRIGLLTRGGRLTIDLPNWPGTLAPLENALIRLRGCLFASWDMSTHRVREGKIAFYDPDLNVDEPAPANPFAVPLKGAGEFQLFDLEANVFQRVRVRGQVVLARQTDFCLMDGSAGLRVVTRRPEAIVAGDQVEVVGFPEPGAPATRLREALVQKVGHAPLPPAILLRGEQLANEGHDSTRVRIEAVLVDFRIQRNEVVLELQSELRGFLARLAGGATLRPIASGSRLVVTGVCVVPEARRGAPNLSPFELLLGSASDVEVLARPPWWTVRRILRVLEIMGAALVLGVLWVATLKRRVNTQTAVIRQQIQRQATLEERNRIAREFHDTLEQALAGVGMQLNALAGLVAGASAEARHILEITRAMVRHSQEEARRSVRNLRTFALDQADLPTALAQTAAQMRGGCAGEIRVRVTGVPRRLPIGIETHLLRIGQEATANAVKHADAKQIALELEFAPHFVRLAVVDDGCGFDTGRVAGATSGHFGLLGLRERAEKLGGTLLLQSAPGAGTTIQFTLPIEPLPPRAEFQS